MTSARVPSERVPAVPAHGAAAHGAAAHAGPAWTAARPVGRTGAPSASPVGAGGARRQRSLRSVLRDRRGATALVFAASAVALFGFAALATEGGNWYFNHRNARSAADMAAMAGASAYMRASSNQSATATTVATQTAQNNGFATGTDTGTSSTTKVTVLVGSWTPPSPPYPAGAPSVPGSVRVTIERTVPTFISGLFLGSNAVTIRVRATAAVLDNGGEACILATAPSGIGLNLLGTANVTATNCVLHSNSTSSDSVKIQSGFAGDLVAAGISATGGCFGNACNNLPNAGGQVQTSAGVVNNPYADLQDIVESYTSNKPAPGPSGCYQVPNQALTQAEATALAASIVSTHGGVFCANNNNNNNNNLGLDNGVTLTLPGNQTYIFWNAGLDLAHGSLSCNACTFIFTGNNGQGGAVRINGGAFIYLETKTGEPNTPLPSAITSEPIVGVSMYRDARSSNNVPGGGVPVQINGGSGSYINGALVFPESEVRYNGNYAGTGSSGLQCVVVIGKYIDFEGTASLNTSGCKANGVRTPLIQVVRLVE